MRTLAAGLGAALGFGLSFYLGYIVLCALRSSTACVAGGKEYERKKRPLIYWIIVGIQFCFFVLMLYAGITRLIQI
jgi:hypothetical protein